MALESHLPFPLLPANPPTSPHPSPTQLHFSRWNNANAQPFIRLHQHQKLLEDQIRLNRRFHSASKISQSSLPLPPPPFTYRDTPSSPSPPSIPSKSSKYSKPHPAFRRPKTRLPIQKPNEGYKLEKAPFEFKYSYTETSRAKPIALREPLFLAFGPGTMGRPWTGRASLPESRKRRAEFDSFRLPPAGKKGVKTVQASGPYLAGLGPRYEAETREEILGEALEEEEVRELVKGCSRSKRQLNMG